MPLKEVDLIVPPLEEWDKPLLLLPPPLPPPTPPLAPSIPPLCHVVPLEEGYKLLHPMPPPPLPPLTHLFLPSNPPL